MAAVQPIKLFKQLCLSNCARSSGLRSQATAGCLTVRLLPSLVVAHNARCTKHCAPLEQPAHGQAPGFTQRLASRPICRGGGGGDMQLGGLAAGRPSSTRHANHRLSGLLYDALRRQGHLHAGLAGCDGCLAAYARGSPRRRAAVRVCVRVSDRQQLATRARRVLALTELGAGCRDRAHGCGGVRERGARCPPRCLP